MQLAERLLTKHEVSRMTSLSPVTIWRQIRAGKFPAGIKISDNRVAWRESDLTNWLNSKANDNT